MSHQPQIIIQQLNYKASDNKSIIRDLTFSLNQQKTAIVGKNGIGKSTLLKLIIGELMPSSGNIYHTGTVSYCPQNFSQYLDKTIIGVFGVAEKMTALDRIHQGSIEIRDFDIVGADWDLRSRITEQLAFFSLGEMAFNRQLGSMSGGEVTRLWLAKVFFEHNDFIILDEPTNNLDLQSKQQLYEAIKQWKKGLIVVSHDRALLGLMDQIIELTSIGAHIYGGNYDAYLEQKTLERTAALRQLKDTQKQIVKTKQSIQKTHEKLEQRTAKGHRNRKSRGQSKLILNSMQERSEKTSNKLSTSEERLLQNAEQKLLAAKTKIAKEYEIKIDIPKTHVPSSKVIAKFEDVTFFYNDQMKTLINNFNFTLCGPERVVFMGENGSGKTTLIKLLLGVLKPTCGEIILGTSRISYLDQNAAFLDSLLTILDNYKKINPDIKETDARFNLADFLFRNIDVLKRVSDLSGGEKLRAALACVLTGNNPPQLLILDEPTNHLDLESIVVLESALNCYQGALLVISHDLEFIKNVRINTIEHI